MADLGPNQTPGYGGEASAPPMSQAASGTPSGGTDPTNEPGQYPASLFGVTLPQGTGAPGSQGAQHSAATDPTNEPGQLNEGLSGLGPDVLGQTGAPGSAGAVNGPGGPDAVTFTRPGSFQSGTYVSDTVHDSVSGTADWTQANDSGYGSGGPQLPGIKGNEPVSTGAGAGRVMRGGRAVG